jgi:hypothetical protein
MVMCALAILAQSGRRVRKAEPAATPAPTAEESPTPTPAAKPATTMWFVVGIEKFGDSSSVPLNVYSGVLRTCTDRLNSGSAKAEAPSSDMSRADAVKQAKSEKEAYVVWLQIRASTNGSSSVYADPRDLYVQFSVLAPVTAKQVTSGSTFPERYRNTGGVRHPTSSNEGDYYLNQAARAAAERILDHFHRRMPSTLP